jgi:hypothetical protein
MSQVVMKGENTSYPDPGDDVTALKRDHGTWLLTRLTVGRFISERVRFGVEGDWKHFDGSDRPDRNGDTFELGPAVTLAIGRSNWCKLRAVYLTGSAGSVADQVDLSGYAVSVGFVWRPWAEASRSDDDALSR